MSLIIALDVDALERSTLARVDRVMLLALEALTRTGVQIALVAVRERQRAAMLGLQLPSSWLVNSRGADALIEIRARQHHGSAIVVSDDPDLIIALGREDCGLVLGRPELAGDRTCSIADTSVRAALWWLLEERNHASTT